jgi:hypothetical protein
MVAHFGYAGLGSSRSGTEPSAWMNDILKGRHGLSIEEQLGAIAHAMKSELPRHLNMMSGEKAQNLIAPAIVQGTVRLYEVSVSMRSGNPIPHLIYVKLQKPCGLPAPFGATGSGSQFLPNQRGWHRDILRVLRAVEAGRVGPRAVADKLAAINEAVARRDQMVSKCCIVQWWTGSGGFQFYDGRKRTEGDSAVPQLANGMDIQDIVTATAPIMWKALADFRAGGAGEVDPAVMQTALDRQHDRPNRKL